MRKTNRLNFQKGTTLIELLLYLALFSIILVVVVDLLFTSGQLKMESESQNSLQQDANLISKRLNYEVHSATSSATPSSSSLVLNVASETHTFSLSSGNLVFQKIVGPSTINANLNSNLTTINSISFTNLGNALGKSIIKTVFTISSTKSTKQGANTKTFEIFSGLR